jgi:isopenicillin-N epimerase
MVSSVRTVQIVRTGERRWGARADTTPAMPTPTASESYEISRIGSTPRASDPAVWPISPRLTMLNHGSYGMTPAFVRFKQDELRARMDADPVRYFKIDLESLCDRARASLSRLVRCEAEDLALVPNATFAVATVLNNLPFAAGDEIVVTDHEYNATLNELGRICARTGAVVRGARVPLPLGGAGEVVESVMGQVGPRTRLVIVSHIASAAGLRFPVEWLVPLVRARGIDILVDGAHAPGQTPIDLGTLAPTFYAGSCHKWLNTPKGSGFFYAERGRQGAMQPLALSCRVHKRRADRKAFLCDFDYVGTGDATANLVIPDAIEHLEAQHEGGIEGIMADNHRLVIEGARLIRERCGLEPTAPDEMFGCMYGLLLPGDPRPGRASRYDDPLWDALAERHGIQAPVWTHDPSGARILRVSGQMYNSRRDYEALAGALAEELARERS